MAILGLNTNRLGAVTGQILRRVIVVFGLSYLFWLVFYLDFLKKSIESVAGLIEPSAITSVPLLITGIAVAVALIVTAATLWVSERAFVRGVVSACAVLNLSTIVSIGLKSPLAWLSLVISIAALFSVWRLPAKRVIGVVFLAGVIVTGYALVDQAVWVWAHRAEPEPEPAQVAPPLTDSQLPSVYIVVMDELPLSIVNEYTSFMSLPNLSRLAQKGIFFPRAYAIADTTGRSIPPFFTGRYLEQEQIASEVSTDWLSDYRNLITDLASLGYQIRAHGDVLGISTMDFCSTIEVSEEESEAVVSRQDLGNFALDHLARQVSFGIHRAANIGLYLHSEPVRVFNLNHQSDQPQLTYIHLFETHHPWSRNRDGSFHYSPHCLYRSDTPEEDASKVARNAFEQILWADNVTGQLVDDLLSIPREERIIVFLSDHGTSWREPPFGRETGQLRTTQVHVPVALVAPDLPPEINTDLLSLIDIYPTIVDLLNKAAGQTVLEVPEGIDGVSLFADQNSRQNRNYYVYVANCKYRLEKDNWVLEERFKGSGPNTEEIVPAEELALTPEAVQLAIDASVAKSLPPIEPGLQGATTTVETPTLLSDNYKGFTIIGAYGTIYGFPKPHKGMADAKVYLKQIEAGEYYPVYTGKTVEEVINAIDSDSYVGEGGTLILAEEGYQGFNIIANRGTLYAILQSDGAFDYERLTNGPYTTLIQGRTVEEVKNIIDDYVTRIIVKDHKGFMLINADGTIYGFPKPDTPLESIEVYFEYIKADKIYPVYTGKTVEEVTGAIDSDPYVGGSGDTLVFVEEGYKGFNIIANKGTLYAILQADGRFGYERLKSGPYTVLVEGRTLAEVKQAIDDYLEE